ncbi:MAG TPA: SDR family NAD(P)-dependent oxidoreductase [Anaerolineaceae bacterium]|nr:SDR family NAD(P)-dependent oxidoreductase [Anaerolineaceae bacterium]HPN51644.1 SDR family NAD(P)-dependent oxidoreductase [Anaerolineaceae bacterium]
MAGLALVTGAAGFLGGALCRTLLAEGWRVRALHRPTSSLRQLEGLDFEAVTGDLTQPDTIHQAMKGVEVVFHTAALLENSDPGRLYTVNVEGTRAVLKAAHEAGVRRVVHTSTVAVLGMPEKGPGSAVPAPIDENHAFNLPPARWPYGYAKYLAELEVQKAVAGGLDAVIVNPSLITGPGDVYRKESAIIVQAARGRLPARIAPPGGINVVHINDVCAGHLAALQHGQTGQRYILAGQNITHFEYLRLTAEITGAPPPRSIAPAWIFRAMAFFSRIGQRFMSMPLGPTELNMAGTYFYYKTAHPLPTPEPAPARQAIEDAWQWFKNEGALS